MGVTLTDVDVGSGPGVGDGDPGRTAFQAINANNTELETEVLDQTEVDARVTSGVASGLTTYKATVNVYTKQQYFGEATLTDATNISWNLDSAQTAKVTLTANRTLDNPTNMKAGATYILRVIQDGGGTNTLAYGSAYKFPGGTDPVLTVTGSAVDILSFYCNGTFMYGVASLDLK
jgi:hypothetical protein